MKRRKHVLTKQEVEEAEANYFAMCLLIPEKFIRADIEQHEYLDEEKIEALAHKYQVPVSLMCLRLVDLKLVEL